MDNFDAHKWFKKQYLEEGHTEDKMERDQAIKRYDQLSADDKLKLAKIQKMMDKERKLRDYYKGDSDVFPSSLKENMSPSEAIVELNFLMDELQNISGEVKQIMRQTFPDEYTRGDAYGAFDFGTSGNQYDTTFEGILDDLASVGDEMEDYD